jgi:hypothetical protein
MTQDKPILSGPQAEELLRQLKSNIKASTDSYLFEPNEQRLETEARIAVIDEKLRKMQKRSQELNASELATPCRPCLHCGSVTEAYMLENEVWHEVHESKRGLICLPCFEEKLGRNVRITDFTNAVVNQVVLFAYRMGLRDGLSSSTDKT